MTLFQDVLSMYMQHKITGVSSPLPHLVGPPGTGKSTVVREVAELLGVKLHTINVSRLSPLDLEGVQVPDHQNGKLQLFTAAWWTRLNEGDIILLDEFLRGFPEVYNGLLDIITSREVGGFELPNVFIIAASNSVVTYDDALEDRLIHVPVPDARAANGMSPLQERLVNELGLHPGMLDKTSSLRTLILDVVLPPYEMLDRFKGGSSNIQQVGARATPGASVRNLIGQVRLRRIETPSLRRVLIDNNALAVADKKYEHIIIADNIRCPEYEVEMDRIRDEILSDYTEVQQRNFEQNAAVLIISPRDANSLNVPLAG